MNGIAESIAFLGLCTAACLTLYLGEHGYSFWLFLVVCFWGITSDWGQKISTKKETKNENKKDQ